MINETQINCAKSLDEIAGLVEKCDRCVLHKTKTMDVPGKGNPKAEILFIGEAPGKKEDLAGEPFIGSAGKFLNEMLAEISLKRENVFISNVVKHRPPENRDPKPEEAKACWPYLKRQIELINPKLIVFLGKQALNSFFPELEISKVHGKAFEKEFMGKKQYFLALYHPIIARFPKKREILITDFKKIPKIIKGININ